MDAVAPSPPTALMERSGRTIACVVHTASPFHRVDMRKIPDDPDAGLFTLMAHLSGSAPKAERNCAVVHGLTSARAVGGRLLQTPRVHAGHAREHPVYGVDLGRDDGVAHGVR